MRRYSVEGEVSRESLAIEAFLGNPLVFYGHHQVFQGGIGNFNQVADRVAEIKPGTKWVSLGEIARHLYRLRQRNDGTFDVFAFSPEITLHNASAKERQFHVEKKEDLAAGKFQLLVDGTPHPANHSGQTVSFTVVVPPGKQRTASIQYLNGGIAASRPVEDSSLGVALRRRMSDFRDVTLSQSSWGRELLRVYYEGGTRRLTAILLPIGFAVLLLLVLRRYLLHRAHRKVRHARVA